MLFTIACFGVIVGWLLMAGIGAYLAAAKNREPWEGVLLGFTLGPVGLLIEALLPRKPAIPAPELVTPEMIFAQAQRLKEQSVRQAENCLPATETASEKPLESLGSLTLTEQPPAP